MYGNTIVVSSQPRGRFDEGIIGAANMKPGIKVQIEYIARTGVNPSSQGRFTIVPYGSVNDPNSISTGDPRETIILLEDSNQGVAATSGTAYTSGVRAPIYSPLAGEEMNVLVAGAAGTGSANAFNWGERLEPISGTGKYQDSVASATVADFIVLEHIDEIPDTDTLVWCRKA